MSVGTQPTRPERGLNNYRIEFCREEVFGVLPTDPNFLLYSSTPTSFSFPPGATIEARRGLGDANPKDFQRGPESHEVTVTYDLERWFVEDGGPGDAAYDAFVRTADNYLANSHTMVGREDKGVIGSAGTVDARRNDPASATAKATRIYSVGRGGLIGDATVTGDPSDSQPLTVELTYTFQKARSFQIDQPNAATTLHVVSTDDADTMDVTIESEDGSTSETLTLSGTTAVASTTEFADIDAFELAEEAQGTVTLHLDDAGTPGEALAAIHGADSYDGVEGDLGVPAVHGGSHDDAAGVGTPERFIGDRVLRANDPYPHEFNTVALSVSNNIETMERNTSFGMALYPGNQELTFEPEIFGTSATHDIMVDHLTNQARDMVWEMTGGDVELYGTAVTEPGERTGEEGQAVASSGHTFTATGIDFVEAV